ncbi:hypothetical protein WJX72_000384 [[Myrmecia] bisecta]|uniref:Uncharacterized protein n=1 Tax=[Myrmecia] bisecta TaxID=41462 RepID=A0AAW1PNY7_9CHLO
MAPLPPVWDPSDAEDKLPLPFRMIDKVLWEIFDKAFKECTSRKDKKAAARTKRLAKATARCLLYARPPPSLQEAQGSSKRNEGLYTYWKGHNRLLLVALNAPAPPVFAPAATPAEKKPDAKAASAPKAAAKAAVDKATAGDAAVTAAAAKVKAAGDWVLPFGITCSHSSSDGSQLALGLADGSVVLWDDCLRGHSAVLPRLSAPVAALGFTSCQPHQLIACTAGGSVHITALASRAVTSLQLADCAILHLILPSSLPLELRTLSGSMRREPRETGDSYASNPRPVRLAGLEAGGSRSAGLDGDSQGGPVNDAETGTQDGKSTVFSMAQTLSAPKGALDPQALSRVMAKISSRNGGRKLRERKIQKHMAELADRCLKESNAKPSLMI